MRILVLTESLEPRGGTEVYVRTEVRLLSERGHEIHLVTADRADPRTQELGRATWRSVPAAFRGVPTWSWGRAYQEMKAILLAVRPDVAHIHLMEGWPALLALVAKCPTLRFVHVPHQCPAGTRWLRRSGGACSVRPGLSCLAVDRREECMTNLDGRRHTVRTKAYRLLCLRMHAHVMRRATMTIANSRFMARELADALAVRENVRVLYPPLSDEWKQPLGPPPHAGRKNVVATGRLEPIKGFDHAVKALALLPDDVELVVVGAGSQREALAELARAGSRRRGFGAS